MSIEYISSQDFKERKTCLGSSKLLENGFLYLNKEDTWKLGACCLSFIVNVADVHLLVKDCDGGDMRVSAKPKFLLPFLVL